MKLRYVTFSLALALAGSAFAATTTETTVTRQTPHGKVTRHVVKVTPGRHHAFKHIAMYRTPAHHNRHVGYVASKHHHKVAHAPRKVDVISQR